MESNDNSDPELGKLFTRLCMLSNVDILDEKTGRSYLIPEKYTNWNKQTLNALNITYCLDNNFSADSLAIKFGSEDQFYKNLSSGVFIAKDFNLEELRLRAIFESVGLIERLPTPILEYQMVFRMLLELAFPNAENYLQPPIIPGRERQFQIKDRFVITKSDLDIYNIDYNEMILNVIEEKEPDEAIYRLLASLLAQIFSKSENYQSDFYSANGVIMNGYTVRVYSIHLNSNDLKKLRMGIRFNQGICLWQRKSFSLDQLSDRFKFLKYLHYLQLSKKFLLK